MARSSLRIIKMLRESFQCQGIQEYLFTFRDPNTEQIQQIDSALPELLGLLC